MATKTGGVTGKRLFGSMGVAGLWCVAARRPRHHAPRCSCTLPIPGVSFAIYNSPQMLAVGFLVGGVAVAFWFLGALVGNFGIIVGGTAAGLWDVTTAQGIVSSLGMGLMMGSGVGVVLKDILPHAARFLRGRGAFSGEKSQRSRLDASVLALMVAAAALVVCIGLGMGADRRRGRGAPLLCHHDHERAVRRPDGHRPDGDLRPHRSARRCGVLRREPGAALLRRRRCGRGVRACRRRHERLQDRRRCIGTNPRAMWVGQAIGAHLGRPGRCRRRALHARGSVRSRAPSDPVSSSSLRRRASSRRWSPASRACPRLA